MLRTLADDPRSHKSRKLEDLPGYRVAVGDYRVLYLIDDKTKVVTIYKIGHRRDIYRD
jgi:mRNA interferase RelE/StbE